VTFITENFCCTTS